MKNIKLIIGLLFSAFIIFSACEEEDLMYKSFDPAKDVAAQTMVLASTEMTIVVNPDLATTDVTLGIILHGSLPDQDITIPIVIDSTTLPTAAYVVNGSGFVIPAGSNHGSMSITLNSSECVPGVVYDLYYKLGTPTSGTINELGAIGQIIAFNPGPLAPWVGNYTGAAVSQNEPGDWDEEWAVTTALDPADPLNNILMKGIAGSYENLVATIDINAGTITIVAGQNIGNVYGYGDSFVYHGEAPYVFTTEDIVGTIDADGTMVIPNIGLTTGPYAWDVFVTTFTKDSKKSGKLNIPNGKKPILLN